MYKKLSSFVAVAMATASILSAQSIVPVHFDNGGTVTDGRYYVGDYNGHVNGNAAILNCVDFFHEVTYGENWRAYQTNLTGDLSHTRLGLAGDPTAQQQYEESAWLVSHYKSSTPTTIGNIQHAVWAIMGVGYYHPSAANYFFDGPGHTLDPNAQFWVDQANAHWDDGTVNYSNYAILTDVRAGTKYDAASAQEFLTTTPEPSSMALLGTGLVGLVPMIRRRKR